MGRPVCRVGDIDLVHCSVPSRLQGSLNVRVNGIPVSRQGDLNTVHQLPPFVPACPALAPNASMVPATMAPRVFVNFLLTISSLC